MPTMPHLPIGVVQLVAKAVKDARARDEVSALLRLVGGDVRNSDLLPFGTHDAVVRRLHEILVQPEIIGALVELLKSSDANVYPTLKARLAELLTFQGIDSQRLADLVVASIDANLSRAKRTDREAMILENERTRAALRNQQVQAADAASTADPSAGLTARALEVARAVVELGPSQADIVQKLAAADPDGGARLQEALAAGGVTRVALAIEAGHAWLEQGSAGLWEAAGRLAESIGRFTLAQRAYERAADDPGVHDRVRQLVRASNAAASQGDDERASALLDAARNEDPKNPAVLLHAARNTADPTQRLEQLELIAPADDDQEALKEILRAEALIGRNEFDAARQAVARARDLEADGRGADEIDAIVTFTEAQALQDDPEARPQSLVAAGQQFARLADEVKLQERWDAVGILTGRAIVSFALAGDSSEATRLLDEAIADARLLEYADARRLLAGGAMMLRRFDDVLTIVPEEGDEDDRLDRAAVPVMTGDAEGTGRAVTDLKAVMQAGGERAAHAAYLLLCASSNNAAIEWDAEAERMVDEQYGSWTATFLRVLRLDSEGDADGAEALALQHSDNPTALRYLVHLAGRREERAKALRLAETLVERTNASSDRLLLAGSLARGGQKDAAIDRLLAVAHDQHASFDDRCNAYARAAQLMLSAERFTDLEALARDWAEYDSSTDPRWAVVAALTMRFRHANALATWRDFGEPEADTEGRALMLAEVFAFAAQPAEALETIAELSDRYNRPEELEVGLMFTAIRLEGLTRELPPELLARIRESFATFPERFPNSTRLRAIALDPENPVGSLIDALGDQLEHRAERSTELAKGVRAGNTAVAMLAAAAGRSTGATLFLLEALPLSYPDDQFERLDRADAASAYASGAVWDPSALFVVASLGRELETKIRSALPASMVARATQQDAAQDLVTSDSAERGEVGFVEGVLTFREWSDTDLASDRRRATEMQRLATDLPAEPLAAEQADDDLTQIATSHAPLPIRSWAATLAVARKLGLPVFSDDRAVRKSAREVGLKAFGTTALLDVLADRGVVAAEERDDVRHRLLSHGAWGLRHAVDELVRLAREAAWQPTPGLRAALGDTTAWIALLGRWAERIVGFLDAVAREAPEHMNQWVHRAVDAATESLGGNYQRHALLLLMVAINPVVKPVRMSDEGLRALIESLRRMYYFQIYKPPADLLVMATAELLAVSDDKEVQAALLRRLLDRLSEEDERLLRKFFVR